jgi:oxygen-independent coproporphyrinogen-3 oxidase
VNNPFEPPSGRLALYIHIPFCERKCNYCAFESAVPAAGETDAYLDALGRELDLWQQRIGKPLLETCYFGGGTPTVLSAAQWRRLADIVEAHFYFADNAEVTAEANPNSLNVDQLRVWRDWRVTRVSVGVQSFDDAELHALGRLHSARQARDAISASLASGFAVSLDLMFALPGQTFAGWAASLHEAVRSGTGHISLYQLSIEKGTPWESLDQTKLPDGYEMYRWAQWYLPKKGFEQYEISNFARPGLCSRHNLNYWREGKYLGAGPAAAGYLGGWRWKNAGSLSAYIKRVNAGSFAFASGERLDADAAAREASVLALRTAAGLDRAEFVSRYGAAAFDYVTDKLRQFPGDLYKLTESGVRLTKKGMRVANIIWAELV